MNASLIIQLSSLSSCTLELLLSRRALKGPDFSLKWVWCKKLSVRFRSIGLQLPGLSKVVQKYVKSNYQLKWTTGLCSRSTTIRVGGIQI